MSYLKPWVDRKSSRPPFTVDGVQFQSWHTGILRYETRNADGRIRVYQNMYRQTHTATVDKISIGHHFRSEKTACAAAVKALKKGQADG